MRPSRAPSLSVGTALVVALTSLSTALAHSDDMEGGGQIGGHNTGNHTDSPQDNYPPTYFSHPGYAGLMYAHIGLMVVAWVFVLPVGTSGPDCFFLTKFMIRRC